MGVCGDSDPTQRDYITTIKDEITCQQPPTLYIRDWSVSHAYSSDHTKYTPIDIDWKPGSSRCQCNRKVAIDSHFIPERHFETAYGVGTDKAISSFVSAGII